MTALSRLALPAMFNPRGDAMSMAPCLAADGSIAVLVPPGATAGLPSPRGPMSEWVLDTLSSNGPRSPAPQVAPVDLGDEDQSLALHLLYGLHYRGYAGVDDGLEWDTSVHQARAALERSFLCTLREQVILPSTLGDVPDQLRAMLGQNGSGPSLSGWCETRAEHWHVRELAVHRSAYQSIEADPHSWALPRLGGRAKAALVQIQFDEYGNGRLQDMHAELFALHLRQLGLRSEHGAHIESIVGISLAAVNLVTMFGMHRRWLGALIGHLAHFEMTSVPVMAAHSAVLKRLGYDAWTRRFHDVHVVADAEHQRLAADELVPAFLEQHPETARDVLFGAYALSTLEGLASRHIIDCWESGKTSLRAALPEPMHIPGLHGDGRRDPRIELVDRVA